MENDLLYHHSQTPCLFFIPNFFVCFFSSYNLNCVDNLQNIQSFRERRGRGLLSIFFVFAAVESEGEERKTFEPRRWATVKRKEGGVCKEIEISSFPVQYSPIRESFREFPNTKSIVAIFVHAEGASSSRQSVRRYHSSCLRKVTPLQFSSKT